MAERKSKPTTQTKKEITYARPPAHTHEHQHSHDHQHEHTHSHDHDEDKPKSDEKPVQTVTVEDAGPARKKLTIELPAERIAKKLDDAYDRLQNDAALPGFRAGRAPMRLIQKRFGSTIRDDVRTQLLSEAYTQAVEDQKLEVLGEPDVKELDKIQLPESGPLSFVVEVEITPKFDLPAFEGLEVKKPTFSVSDEDIQGETRRLQLRMGTLKTITDAGAEGGDYLTTDLVIRAGHDAKEDAEEIVRDPKAMVLVPGEEQEFKGNIAGIAVDGLGKKLEGKKVGDTVTLSLTGPTNHEDERVKDKPITVTFKIETINRQAPATMHEVVTMAGLESEEQVKDRIKKSLEGRLERQQEAAMHQQVCQWLLEQVTFDLPEGLTGRQTSRVLRRRAMELAYQGVPEQEIQQRVAELRASSEEDARRQLKLFFLLDQAAKNMEIEVSEGEVNGRIAMMAVQQGRRPEKLRQQMQRNGEIESLFLSIREQKTLDKIIGSAKVVEVPLEELEKEQSKAADKDKAPEKATEKTADAAVDKPADEGKDKKQEKGEPHAKAHKPKSKGQGKSTKAKEPKAQE